MVQIVLFKSCVEDGEDVYLKTLKSNSFDCCVIPVLDFEYQHLKQLWTAISNPDKYSALVFTSPRAVEAFFLAVDTERDSWETHFYMKWKTKLTFVIGRSTETLVKSKLKLECIGSESGNAVQLADIIRQNALNDAQFTSVLFPCGNLKREDLPIKLNEYGITFDCIIVYFTKPHTGLNEKITNILFKKDESSICVFFSPSGVKFTLPILHTLDLIDKFKFIAFGPSTKLTLEESNVEVLCVSEEPSPSGLLKVLKDHVQFHL